MVFSPTGLAPVPVVLTCTSGTVITTLLLAAEGAPAVFMVSGASPGATCTAAETVPAGYTGNQTDCVDVALGGSCTISNTLIGAQIPTLSEWAVLLLASLLSLLGVATIRRRLM
jgi:hypothetical protein